MSSNIQKISRGLKIKVMKSWLFFIPAGHIEIHPHVKYQLAIINRSWDSTLYKNLNLVFGRTDVRMDNPNDVCHRQIFRTSGARFHADRTTVCFEPWQKPRARLGSRKTGLSPPPPPPQYFNTDRSKAVLLLWFLTVTCSSCPYLYFSSAIMLVTYFSKF